MTTTKEWWDKHDTPVLFGNVNQKIICKQHTSDVQTHIR